MFMTSLSSFLTTGASIDICLYWDLPFRRAVGLGASGNVYVGVNLEFPGLPLNNSVGFCMLECRSSSPLVHRF